MVGVDLTIDTLPESSSDCQLSDTTQAECHIGIRWYSEPHESIMIQGTTDLHDYTSFGDTVTYVSATYFGSKGWERWM
ncbi:unnamed protein product [Adineta steineri]|uniref:Uncharacterized protein n=1 Tax=Adineta steineri TaxID=433720 RepID=A0A814KFZ6_9BILA|nr:unnamed protein product [Adineta steineri]CAF1052105.1 unnamed protein product [Adineta steineri]